MSFFVLFAATAAVLAFATSLLVGLGLRAALGRGIRLTPAAEARFLFVLALLPFLVTAVVMTGAMAPSFGWIADHCRATAEAHAHPHLCGHHIAAFPGLPIIGLAMLLAARGSGAAIFALAAAVRLLRARRDLDATCSIAPSGGFRVVPTAEPQAFLLGVFRPRLYVTRGLLAPDRSQDAEVVIAHERSHLARRDPARRVLASFGLAFHVPGIARALERRLACAHEMAADADAARVVGSAERVARTIVDVMRARLHHPRPSVAFGATSRQDTEARVRRLLDTQPRHEVPGMRALAVTVITAQAVVLLAADGVHHGVEHVLGLLGG